MAGLSRPSTPYFLSVYKKEDVDARHKAGHDVERVVPYHPSARA